MPGSRQLRPPSTIPTITLVPDLVSGPTIIETAVPSTEPHKPDCKFFQVSRLQYVLKIKQSHLRYLPDRHRTRIHFCH